jgi:hypothetical protein
MLEQSDSPSEQDGHQVDVYLVKQPGSYALLRDTRGSYGDVLVTCDPLTCSTALSTPSVTKVKGDPS